jgi:glycosyltransferase involved in cell wall biosynthesis
VDAQTGAHLDLDAANAHKITVPTSEAPIEASAPESSRKPLDMLRFTCAVAREDLDVFFSPTVYTYFPLPPGLRVVVAIHDTIADRYPELCLPTARDRWFWRMKTGLAIRQASLILTVSRFAAGQIVDLFRIPRDRIRVAGEAPSEAYRRSESAESIADIARSVGLPPEAEWFVYVGGFNPHKNVDVLVRAHGSLVRERPVDAPYLVLVGDPGSDVFLGDEDAIGRALRESGGQERVLWTGFVPDEDLRHLHSGALALVLPSAEEGFGLPAVEAAACGCPVIATTESPLPELLPGGGLFIPPGNEAALTAAMRSLHGDASLRSRLGSRALEGARLLTWEKGARSALDAIYEAAA